MDVNILSVCVCVVVVTDGDGVPSSRRPRGGCAVARAKPPGDEGGEPPPLEPRVGSVHSCFFPSISCYSRCVSDVM